jgi:hypothetical protein
VRASTSDLLPTSAAIAGQPLPDRPLDGIDLTRARWHDDRASHAAAFLGISGCEANQPGASPTSIPELQKGTTPLVKKMGGKATRDFTNFKHPVITEADYLGPRCHHRGRHKLVIHEQKQGEPKIELFDFKADPAETTNIFKQQPEAAEKLKTKLRAWQDSVLKSLTGADYQK